VTGVPELRHPVREDRVRGSRWSRTTSWNALATRQSGVGTGSRPSPSIARNPRGGGHHTDGRRQHQPPGHRRQGADARYLDERVLQPPLGDPGHGYDAALITLDEVDRLGDDNVLMLLSRAREGRKVDVPIGIISISNKVNFREQMTERVKEQPRAQRVHLRPLRRRAVTPDSREP